MHIVLFLGRSLLGLGDSHMQWRQVDRRWCLIVVTHKLCIDQLRVHHLWMLQSGSPWISTRRVLRFIVCPPPPSVYLYTIMSKLDLNFYLTHFFELSFCTMFVFMCEWVELYEVFLVICCPRTWDCNVQRTVSNYTVCCSVDSRLINARFELQRSGNAPISLPSVYVTSFMW